MSRMRSEVESRIERSDDDVGESYNAASYWSKGREYRRYCRESLVNAGGDDGMKRGTTKGSDHKSW